MTKKMYYIKKCSESSNSSMELLLLKLHTYMRPIKQRSNKQCYQLSHRIFNILKSTIIPLPPQFPHKS